MKQRQPNHRTQVKKSLRFHHGLGLVVTKQLLEYLEKKNIQHDYKLEESIMVLDYQSKKVRPVAIGREADPLSKAIFVSENAAGDAHLVWQIVQLGAMSDGFFREIAHRIGGIYGGVTRIAHVGWKGAVTIQGEGFFPWTFLGILSDADANAGMHLREEFIQKFVEGIVMNYEVVKTTPQPTEGDQPIQ